VRKKHAPSLKFYAKRCHQQKEENMFIILFKAAFKDKTNVYADYIPGRVFIKIANCFLTFTMTLTLCLQYLASRENE